MYVCVCVCVWVSRFVAELAMKNLYHCHYLSTPTTAFACIKFDDEIFNLVEILCWKSWETNAQTDIQT